MLHFNIRYKPKPFLPTLHTNQRQPSQVAKKPQMQTCKSLFLMTMLFGLLLAGCSNNITHIQQKNSHHKEAKQPANAINEESRLALASDYDHIGNQLFLAYDYEKALSYYKQAFEIRSQTPGSSPVYLSESLYNLATINEVRELYNEAETSYRLAINILQKHNRKYPTIANNFLGYLTAIKYQQSFSSTEKELKNILLGYKQIHDPDNIRVSAVQHRLANLYLKSKNYPASETAFKSAMLICQQHIGVKHPYYALILNDYSQLLEITKTRKQANQLRNTMKSILHEYPKKSHTKLYRVD